ncbi:MAG: preprotein translocase subunit YajC [Bacteroidales bacterium]
MNLQSILLQAQATGGMGGYENLILIAAIIVIFYFFMIRPQMKGTKEQKKFRETLSKGQKIVTIGGIHGKIVEVEEQTVIIETEGQNRLKLEKSAIASSIADQLTDAK